MQCESCPSLGPNFWSHELVFFLYHNLDSTLSCQVIQVNVFATIMSFRGQILKESSNPVSSPSKKTGWYKNRSPGSVLMKIWAGFCTPSRHLTFQALHKEPKYRLLDLYFKKCLKEVVQCWQTITSSISQRTEIQKGMQ